jgi:hypothetical protein
MGGVQRGIGFFQRHGGADFDEAVALGDLVQIFHLTDVEQVAQFAELLGYPQADVRAAGQDADVRLGGLDRAEFGGRARGVEMLAARVVVERLAALQAAQRVGDLAGSMRSACGAGRAIMRWPASTIGR